VVLIGAERFDSADLPDIPAVRRNVDELAEALTDPARGVLRSGRPYCRTYQDPKSLEEFGALISAAAAEAEDLLLVYYAGHGLLDDDGRLYLALRASNPSRVAWSCVPVEQLKRDLGRARARTRVLILDCCFSGRAIEGMANVASLVSGQLHIAGTYVLTSTTDTMPSHAPAGEPHTSFTGAFLRALAGPGPVDLDAVYRFVSAELAALGLPPPRCQSVNEGRGLVLIRGTGPEPRNPESDHAREAPARAAAPGSVTFGRSGFVPRRRRLRRTAGIALLAATAAADYFAEAYGGNLQIPAYVLSVLPVMVGIGLWLPDHQVRLTVDGSGIMMDSIASTGERYRHFIPREDIDFVGLLGSTRVEKGDSWPPKYRLYHNLILIRLHPSVRRPVIRGTPHMSHLEKLGYLYIGGLDSLGTDPVTLRNTMLRHGIDYCTAGELLDRDHRLTESTP